MQEYFNFDKFVDDLDKRNAAEKEALKLRAEMERNNRTRDLNSRYREHHLAQVYVGDRND